MKYSLPGLTGLRQSNVTLGRIRTSGCDCAIQMGGLREEEGGKGVGSGLISPPVTERAVILRFIGEIYMDTVLVGLVLCSCLRSLP